MTTERLQSLANEYIKDGEEYKVFSYDYREEQTAYRNVYYFDRKKGAYKVTGFLIIDDQEQVVGRQKAMEINQAFNLYNEMFRRFRGEWGDVVQQDMRKYQASMEHFEGFFQWSAAHQAGSSADREKDVQVSDQAVQSWVEEGFQTVKQVLQDQDTFLRLDLAAIDLGQKRKDQGFIDAEIHGEVKRIMKQFEYTIFHQLDLQYETKPKRERYIAWYKASKPDKAVKKHAKKIKRIYKRMNKLVTKLEERILARKEDPCNEKGMENMLAKWNNLLRN